jgi:hypothetical protein
VHSIFISGVEENDVALLLPATTAWHRAAVKHDIANNTLDAVLPVRRSSYDVLADTGQGISIAIPTLHGSGHVVAYRKHQIGFSVNPEMTARTGCAGWQRYWQERGVDIAPNRQRGGDAVVSMRSPGFLVADVNQNRVVSLADLGLVNALLSQPVTAANFLKDVNASGTLTLADKGITSASLTKALPPP